MAGVAFEVETTLKSGEPITPHGAGMLSVAVTAVFYPAAALPNSSFSAKVICGLCKGVVW